MAVPFYVYLILCEDGSFYTGYSKNVKSRMRSHMNGKGARYTRIHKPSRLVYVEKFKSRVDAMRRERRIKTLNHHQKLQLANSQSDSTESKRV